MRASLASPSQRPLVVDLESISQAAFVAGWTSIVGEPPAAMLDDRRAMIAMLVEAAEIATDQGRARLHEAGAAGRRAAPDAPRAKLPSGAGVEEDQPAIEQVRFTSPVLGMLAA